MDNVKKNVKKLYVILIVIFICGAVALILRNNWDRSGLRDVSNLMSKERLAEARAKKRTRVHKAVGARRDRNRLRHRANLMSKKRRAKARAQERAQELEGPRGDCVYNNRTSCKLCLWLK